jgi:hypothetical protein
VRGMRPLDFQGSRGQLGPDTDPDTIRPALAAASGGRRSVRLTLQFNKPLPDSVLSATAAALAAHPEVELYVYGAAVDESLSELDRFRHVQHLSLNIRSAISYEPIRHFHDLRTLVLQGGQSKALSIDFVAELPLLRRLSVHGVTRGAEALSQTKSLNYLSCSAQSSALDALRGHRTLRVLSLHFGATRDLVPVAEIPGLRGLEIYQIRKLDAADLAPLGDCHGLEALSLGALPNLTDLRALRRAPSASLRALILEKISGLISLDDIGECQALEQLGLFESRPADRSLIPLTQLSRLDRLVIGDVYPKAEIEQLDSWYAGTSFHYRHKVHRGDLRPRWRTPVERLLSDSA